MDKGPVAENPLSSKPIGTGPYKVVSSDAKEVRFEARQDYWDGAPAVKEMVVSLISDDGVRAQRVASGELDGAAVPLLLAKGFRGRSGVEVVTAKTADWRGISLPNTEFLSDPAVRRAINLAVDRRAMVDGPLSGQGSPISTPLSQVYGEAYNKAAEFGHDLSAAERLLDDAGWKRDADGIREKGGKKASVTLFYLGEDTLRRDLAIEFSAQMKKIGVDFKATASNWDEITPKLGEAAALLGGGENSYDADLMAYEQMHSREKGTSEYANPGNFSFPALDSVLEEARVESDGAARAALYCRAQELYVANPSAVFLASVDHTYLQKPNKWNNESLVLEPHIHGATWGPWWDVQSWKR